MHAVLLRTRCVSEPIKLNTAETLAACTSQHGTLGLMSNSCQVAGEAVGRSGVVEHSITHEAKSKKSFLFQQVDPNLLASVDYTSLAKLLAEEVSSYIALNTR